MPELDPAPWVETACVWEYMDRFKSPYGLESPEFTPRAQYSQDREDYK